MPLPLPLPLPLSLSLSACAQRVLGALIEKALATPQQYPLTLNSLRTACNQTTGREPVVAYDDADVETALAELREPRLVRTEVVKGSRTPKYSHRVGEQDVLGLDRRDQAVLALLLLRGPQTEGEINSRSDRLSSFRSLEEVDEALASLAARGHVERLERRPGEKAQRWRHLWGPTGAATDHATPTPAPPSVEAGTSPHRAEEVAAPSGGGLDARVAALEAEVAALRTRLDALAPHPDR